MAKQYGFYLKVDRCVECYSCETACKMAHDIEPGPRWRRVVKIWDGQFPSVAMRSVSISCMHCGKPACAAVCPVDAITKRQEDGIVVVDRKVCIGCHACLAACPFGAPQYGKDGTMQKCNLCLERLTAGRPPACTTTCPGEALQFGTMEDLSQRISVNSARKWVGATQPSAAIVR